MSRRTNGPPDKGAQNAAAIKTLLKLNGNKSCADCKKTKHPRWASWNLGVFVCIRCSGIHRGMGTHISRVKSVDLDAWTDDQLASVTKWGNVRANRYWEAKLADGHIPSETKMENFIRTKYESKRWVMDGPMPDPSSLADEADEEVSPQGVQGITRPEPSTRQPLNSSTMHKQRPHPVDLFGDDDRSVSAPLPQSKSNPPKQIPAPGARPAKQDGSLLDIFGSSSAAAAFPNRPSSAVSALSQGPSRGDLKNSIMSLYSSAPRAQTQSQPSHNRGASASSQQSQNQSSLDSFQDAFSGLSFGQTSAPKTSSPPQPSRVSDFSAFTQATKTAPLPTKISSPTISAFPNEWVGSAAVVSKKAPSQQHASLNDDWGDFDSGPSPPPAKQTSAMNDLFDMPAPSPLSPPIAAVTAKSTVPTRDMNPPPIDASVFQLSNTSSIRPPRTSVSKPTPNPATSNAGNFGAWGNNDNAWADNAWATPDPAPAPTSSAPKPITSTSFATALAPTPGPQSPIRTSYKPAPTLARAPTNEDFGGWSSGTTSTDPIAAAMQMPASLSIDAVEKARTKPIVSQDEDFGGWAGGASPVVAKPVTGSAGAATKTSTGGAGGFGGGDDLFSNVWG